MCKKEKIFEKKKKNSFASVKRGTFKLVPLLSAVTILPTTAVFLNLERANTARSDCGGYLRAQKCDERSRHCFVFSL